jgi:hypothetical protein
VAVVSAGTSAGDPAGAPVAASLARDADFFAGFDRTAPEVGEASGAPVAVGFSPAGDGADGLTAGPGVANPRGLGAEDESAATADAVPDGGSGFGCAEERAAAAGPAP